eukprot:RCo007347
MPDRAGTRTQPNLTPSHLPHQQRGAIFVMNSQPHPHQLWASTLALWLLSLILVDLLQGLCRLSPLQGLPTARLEAHPRRRATGLLRGQAPRGARHTPEPPPGARRLVGPSGFSPNGFSGGLLKLYQGHSSHPAERGGGTSAAKLRWAAIRSHKPAAGDPRGARLWPLRHQRRPPGSNGCLFVLLVIIIGTGLPTDRENGQRSIRWGGGLHALLRSGEVLGGRRRALPPDARWRLHQAQQPLRSAVAAGRAAPLPGAGGGGGGRLRRKGLIQHGLQGRHLQRQQRGHRGGVPPAAVGVGLSCGR